MMRRELLTSNLSNTNTPGDVWQNNERIHIIHSLVLGPLVQTLACVYHPKGLGTRLTYTLYTITRNRQIGLRIYAKE